MAAELTTYRALVAYGRALTGGSVTDDYQALVAAGQAAVKAETGAQWAIGDLAMAVETHYGEGKLQAFADDIALEYDTLRIRRWVSRQWPENVRRRTVSWSVHHELAAQETRFDLIRKVKTVRDVRELLGKKVPLNRQPQTTAEKAELVREYAAQLPPAEKAEMVRDALTDEDVMEKVIDDRDARQALSRAQAQRAKTFTESHRDPDIDAADATRDRQGAALDVIAMLAAARQRVRDALRRAMESNLTPGQRQELREELARLREVVDLMGEFIDGETLDEALEKILDGQL